MNENYFSLTSFLKISNIENVYSWFEETFIKNKNNNESNKMIIEENSTKLENNFIEQWKFLIIIFKKDKTIPYFSYLRQYEYIISSKTKNYLF